MTTAASRLELYLDRRWPALTFERFNCRRIAGTSTYSQHSWPGGNARDIFGSRSLLDTVAAHLRTNRSRLGLKVILWQVPDHYDHVHADLWPTGYGTPPCLGGRERYRYSSGRIVYASGGYVAPQGTFDPLPPEDPEMPFTPEEITALKALAPYSDFLVAYAKTILSPGPTTGKLGSYASQIHMLETYRIVAIENGIDPTNHRAMAALLAR